MVASGSTSAESRLRQERDFYRRLLELGTEEEITPLLKRALELVVGITGAQNGYIEIRDETLDAAGRPSCWWRARGFSRDDIPDVQSSISRGVIAEALATGQSIRTGSAMDDDRFCDLKSVQVHEIRAVLCAPVGTDPPMGVVYLQGRKDGREFDAEDQWHAEAFARHLAPFADRLLEHRRQRREEDATRAARARCDLRDIVGRSEALGEALERVALAAPVPVDVLLTGPTGTGKTAIAHVIHRNSPWGEGPFVEFNCGTIPEGLAESELFGAARGAHSAADRDVIGKVEAAEGGTLFLDEVGELPLGVQVKLLQFLQEKRYRPLGSVDLRTASVRLITATNRDLKAMVDEGAFRADLYYRLNTLPIRIPPLSERREDVRDLVRHFAARYSGAPPTGLGIGRFTASPSALYAAEAADWPGNVRELANRVRTAIVLCHGDGQSTIETRHLFPERDENSGADAGDGDPSLQEATRRFQRELVRRTLERSGWNKSEAARRLDVSRSSIHNYIKAFGLDEPED